MMEGQPAEKAAGSSPLEEEASQPAEKSEENIPKPKKSTSMSEENIPQRTSEPTSEVNTPKAAKKSSKPSEKTPVSGQSPGEPTLSPSSPFWGPFKAGWVRELVYRSNVGPNNKRADAYYKSPVGKKYRSLKEIERAIDEGKPGFGGLDVNNFTFNQYPLGVGDPSKEIIRGSDPNRQFNHAKRPSEAGESDSPVKKPKRMSAKLVPRTSTETPPKRKVVTAPPKNVPAVLQEAAPRPATLPVVTPPRPYPQTAVRSQIRPYKQQVVGPRTMGFGSGIRPIATNLLMNRTVQKVKTKAFSNAALPPSPQKSTEEIVCEPAIYGIGRSPEKPTISSALQAMTQKTATPTPARVYQIVPSKRLTVPFTVPPQDLELDGIATIAPSEVNTYVEVVTPEMSMTERMMRVFS